MNNLIGERLVELRNEKNMTQEEFAENIGVSRQAVSKWELDKTFPDVDKLIKISELYQVSVDYILKGDAVAEKQAKSEHGVSDGIDSKADSDVMSGKKILENGISDSIGTMENNMLGSIGTVEDVADDVPENGVTEKGKLKKRLLICVILVGILTVFMTGIVLVGLSKMVWNKSDNTKTLMRVDAIYEQYSRADVSIDTGSEKYTASNVLIDTSGVKVGDYVYGYLDEDSGRILVDYRGSTMLLPIITTALLIIIFIMLCGELKRK